MKQVSYLFNESEFRAKIKHHKVRVVTEEDNLPLSTKSVEKLKDGYLRFLKSSEKCTRA